MMKGSSTCEKQKSILSYDQPQQWDYYEPNLNTLEISFATRITKGDTHKETTITVLSRKQKSCATRNSQARAFQTSFTA